MFNNTSEFELAMRELLICIKNESNLNLTIEKYGNKDGGDALAECINRGYTSGISYNTNFGGIHIFSSGSNVRLTFSGLSFLEKQ